MKLISKFAKWISEVLAPVEDEPPFVIPEPVIIIQKPKEKRKYVRRKVLDSSLRKAEEVRNELIESLRKRQIEHDQMWKDIDDLTNTASDTLRFLLSELNFTQTALAEELGTSRAYVWMITHTEQQAKIASKQSTYNWIKVADVLQKISGGRYVNQINTLRIVHAQIQDLKSIRKKYEKSNGIHQRLLTKYINLMGWTWPLLESECGIKRSDIHFSRTGRKGYATKAEIRFIESIPVKGKHKNLRKCAAK